MNWLSFLKAMMIEEKAARDKYQLAMDVAEDPAIRAIFEKLRDEEVFHVQFIEEQLERLESMAGSV